jgi:hypothetical protein
MALLFDLSRGTQDFGPRLMAMKTLGVSDSASGPAGTKSHNPQSAPTMTSSIAHKIQPWIPAPLYRTIWSYVARRNANRWLESQGVFALALQVAARFDYTVQSGIFKGMKYPRSAILSRHATPMLIGQYERQIYPALMAASARTSLVIDIGHAEGYFAVGFAMHGKRVVAFDVDPHERRVFRQMAKLNGVADRISFRSWCSPETLLALTRNERALIISDIDGGEIDLFRPALISSLRHCDLIIEMHAGTAEENQLFVNRFRDSHRLEIIDHPAEAAGVDLIDCLGAEGPRMAYEYRGFQQWMIASAKG